MLAAYKLKPVAERCQHPACMPAPDISPFQGYIKRNTLIGLTMPIPMAAACRQ